VGRRSSTETVVAILVALLERRTWEQAELARRVGVATRTLRRCLDEMTRSGIPLERDEEPPRVYWSVPAAWLPGAASLSGAEVAGCVRLLARLPRTDDREALLARLLGPRAVPSHANDRDAMAHDRALGIVEDSLRQRVALRISYRAASTGKTERRHVSVQRVEHVDPPRFVAVCHRDDQLKRFRVDRVEGAEAAPAEPFRGRSADEIRAYIDGSFDAFRAGEVVPIAFSIRDPEARWAVFWLPSERCTVSRNEDGVRVEGVTAGLVTLARYLVGLGGAVSIESELLREEVRRIAREALEEEGHARPGIRRAMAEPRERSEQRRAEGGSGWTE